MITFWLICAGFVAIALAFILPPLLRRPTENGSEGDRREANLAVYRDQLAELESDRQNGIVSEEQYQLDRIEIERRLLEEVATLDDSKKEQRNARPANALVYVIALSLPLLAVGLYLRIGNQNAISAAPATVRQVGAADQPGSERLSQENIEANLAALRQRLDQNPKDSEGWTMLARSYSALQRYREASEAYERASKLVADDAGLWADYAFTLAMANGQTLQGRPTELIKQALKVDSENPKALELAGSAAFEAKDYSQAVVHWEKLLKRLPAHSEVTQSVTERIERAKELGGGAN